MEEKCCQCMSSAELLEKRLPTQFAELKGYIDSLPLSDDKETNRGYLIQTLHKAQGIYGYLPPEVQQYVADRLKIFRSEVYGVISFYSYFTDKPIGRFKVNVCTGTACFVKGANKLVDELRRTLNIKEGETTPDGKYFFGALRCVGTCSLAPVVMVNERVYAHVTPSMIPQILADCKE